MTTVSPDPPTFTTRLPSIPTGDSRGHDPVGASRVGGDPDGASRPGSGDGEVVRVGAATVRLRRVASGDGPALTAALGRMSLRTRWLRFHSPIVRFSGAQLRMLLESDHRDRSVLLAEVEVGPGRWQLVGFAQ